MDRIYVIMENRYVYDPYSGYEETTEPIDFKPTIEEAETLCLKYEKVNPKNTYYWREVIASK